MTDHCNVAHDDAPGPRPEPTCHDADTDGVHCDGPVTHQFCDVHALEMLDMLLARSKERRRS